MDYSARIEKANDYDYSDEPIQAVVDRQRDIIELQARQIMALQAKIAEMERKAQSVPQPALNCEHDLPRGCCAICAEQKERERMIEWNMNVRADGAYQE